MEKNTQAMDIVTRFQWTATRNAEKCALKFQNISYSYRELDRITTVIANRLKTYVPEHSVIAFYMDKSDRCIILILSILKCGCTYLPLSKIYPEQRIAYILEQAHVDTVIVSEKSSTLFSDRVNCFCYEELLQESCCTTDEKQRICSGDDIAYILFTSGSTGTPKGIAIRHSSVLNLVDSMKDTILQEQTDKNIAVLSPLVFDVSMGQIFLALLSGNTLDVISDDTKAYCDQLEEFFATRDIYCCEITPTRLNMQLKYYEDTKRTPHFPPILLSVGEALPLGIAKNYFKSAVTEHSKLINYYGPTETCIYSSFYCMDAKKVETMQSMFIGKAIYNTTLYILDENLRPCTIGELGELYIGGSGLAVGYLNQPELTEKAFLPNPFEDGKRIYKTNDLVRMTESGEIEYIGRKDRQIKLHGFRIELSEIERVMELMEGITGVYCNKYSTIDEEFIALYFTATFEIDLKDILEHLKRTLPYYMIPSYFVKVPSFEYTLNGKLDGSKLPEPREHAIQFTREDSDTVDSKIKDILYDICCDILRVDHIVWEHNFVRAGGDSLAAFQLNLAISKQWGIMFDMEELFHCESLSYLAILIQKKMKQREKSIIQVNEESPIYANGFQKTILKVEADSLHRIASYGIDQTPTYNMVYLIQSSCYIEKEKLRKALKQVVDNQEMLRCTFVKVKSRYQIQFHEECADFYKEIMVEEDLDKINFRPYIQVFEADQLPLFQVICFENHQGEQCLLLNFYHTIFDVLSLRIFIEQLFHYYFGSPVKKAGISMKEYLLNSAQKDWSKEYQFWKDYLKGRPDASIFTPDQANNSFTPKKEDRFCKMHFQLSKNIMAQVRLACKQIGITEYIFFLSIFGCTLYSLEKMKSVITGTYVMGRDSLAMESELIGLFTKFIPFRMLLHPEDTFEQFFVKLREQFLVLNSHIGFEINDLIRCMYPEDIMRGALIWTSFNIQSDYCTYFREGNCKITTKDISMNPDVLPFSMVGTVYDDYVQFEILYLERLYSKERIVDIWNTYEKIVELAATDVTRSLSGIEDILIKR